LHLIWNGVDLSEINSVTVINDSVIKAKADGNFVIGYIGRLVEGKGLDVLFAALSCLEIGRWILFIIGEGPQQTELEGLSVELGLKENIRFLGFRPDRLDFLRGFDVFILPSRSEGLPRSLMEAMGAGTTVIATDIPGCNDLIKHGKTGLLFEMDDHIDLSVQIEKLANSEKLRSSLAKAAFSFVTENYSAVQMAQQYQNCFLKLID
jgi:glycosyltransferase involved in cell wall biosynthesis